jgi:hypothetical protein
MRARDRWLWVIGLCAAVAVTSRYTDFAANHDLIDAAAGDSFSYFAMAQAAPGVPKDSLAFHHSQRIAIPYALGLVHRVVPIPMHRLFQAAVFAIEAATLLLFASLLEHFSIRGRESAAMLAMLALNPWAFHFYVTFPEMLNDLGFVLGLTLLLRGLVSGSIGGLGVGLLIASLSRQTGLLLLPFVAAWIWRDTRTWARHGLRGRVFLIVGAGSCSLAVYIATAHLAARFSAPSENVQHLIGLADWLAHDFDPSVLLPFALRMAAPILIPVACLVGMAGRKTHVSHGERLIPLLIFGTVCCSAQPFLAGPEITGGNGERLVGLGLVPLVLALAIKGRDSDGLGVDTRTPRFVAIVALLAVGSLHHLYTNPSVPHPTTNTAFAIVYATVCAALFMIVRSGIGAFTPPIGEPRTG